MDRFKEHVVVVTGAGSGIGLAAASRFQREGASLVLADISEARLQEVPLAEEHLRVCVDISDAQAVRSLVDATMRHFGRVDVVVANAGLFSGCPFLDLSEDDFDRTMAVNLRGTFLTCRDYARAMVHNGSGGAFVITASTNSFMAEPDSAAYSASKGGVAMLIKSMAVDLARFGIRVNGIAPGVIRTNITGTLAELGDGPRPGFAFPPARRWGVPDDCAGGIAFLASDDARYITGSLLVIDGGQTALNGVAE